MGFGVLIDNTIKRLTFLHEIMSWDLIQDVILNEVTHVLQANVYIPLAFIYMCNKQSWEQGIHGWYKGSNIYIEACLTYDGIQNDKQRSWEWDMSMLLHSLKLGRLVIWDVLIIKGSKQGTREWDKSSRIYVVSNWKACI